ncbi:aminotransferase class V-fold PLP-dependent enzyme [candidate division WOR-3 bacterium]|nr:aminotransferase class V-fold PLP-dependent enzyme [candidate division WOR-3 bacterium]
MDAFRLAALRELFPVTREHVYLNHAGTGPLSRPAVAAVEAYLREQAETGEVPWPDAEAIADRCRARLGQLLQVSPDTIAFTRNTSHGIVLAVNSIDWPKGANVVLMKDAFPAVNYPFRLMLPDVEKRWTTSAELAAGPEAVFGLVDDRTRAVALPWVHFLTGRRFDVQAIARFCRERGITLIVDAIQGLGIVEEDWAEVGADFVCSHGAKWLLAPQGSGFLYVRPDILPRLRPANLGWLSSRWESFEEIFSEKPVYESARRLEEGTRNYLGIAGLDASLGLLLDIGIPVVEARVRALGHRLRVGLEAAGWEVVTPPDPARSAGIIAFRKPGLNPSRVLTWLKQAKMVCALREGLLRIAPHVYNSEYEIDRFLERLNDPRAATAEPAPCAT